MDYATVDALGDKLVMGAIFILIVVWLVSRKRKTPKD
jgi:hypothetical protein